MNVPGRKTNIEVYHNTKTALYPDGSSKTTICSKAIFREHGYEEIKKSISFPEEKRTYNTDGNPRNDNLRRAVNSAFDIAAMNPFTHFLTVTINPKNDLGLDRTDSEEVGKRVKKWLDNRVQMWPGFLYLLLPELHKKGGIHCHALVAGLPSLVDSGTVICPGFNKPVARATARKHGHDPDTLKTVYNVPSWTLGHSTAIALYGDSTNVAKYVTKYITKDAKKIFGNFYYAGGHGLKRKPPFVLSDSTFQDIDARVFEVKQAGLSFKYINTPPVSLTDTSEAD